VPEGKHIHRIAVCFVMIKGHVTRISKWNDQLAQFRKITKRPAYLRFCFPKREMAPYSLAGTHHRLGILLLSLKLSCL